MPSGRLVPLSRIIAGPMRPEEGILYADCNLDLGIQMKLRHDFAGHYNRPDIFQLHVNSARPRIYDINGARQPESLPDAQRTALESHIGPAEHDATEQISAPSLKIKKLT